MIFDQLFIDKLKTIGSFFNEDYPWN